VLGAFVAGILVGQSPILTTRIDDELRGITAGLFMPVFFALTGLSADLTFLADPRLAMFTVLLIVIASFGKAAGAFTGGRLGGLHFKQSVALAAGMNARGSTEVIVASIGLSMGVLSENLFTMIVAMAFVTTIAMPPTLRWALGRLPTDESEQKRLAREIVDAQTFLAELERLLVVADSSANGAFAVRIAGLIAGMRGTPVTLLRAGEKAETPALASAADQGAGAKDIITGAAAEIPREANAPAERVDVIERRHDLPWEEAVAAEAAKGYDLMIVGVRPTVSSTGGFDAHISRLAHAFPGALAIVSARGVHEDDRDAKPTILVPVTGSEVSQRGAELAIALGKAASTTVTALSVITPEARDARNRYSARRRDARQTAKELKAIADGLEQPLETTQRTDISPEDAILREARRSGHNLIVLGVSRRPGDQLSFGNLATALLESSDRSLLFLAPNPRSRPTTTG
jgi:nucleotide-binding universal stress UspA family protein